GGYQFTACDVLTMAGCGCEQIDGTGVLIDGCYNVNIQGLANFDNRDTLVHVTGNASGIELGHVCEVSPATSATASIRVDPRCRVSLKAPRVTSPMDLAPGTTVFVDSSHY